MILVTGATGKVGSEVVRQLADAGEPVRALTRNPANAVALQAPGIEIVQGDLADPATLPPALDGADRVFLLTTTSPDQPTLEGNLIDAARQAGTRHVAKLSVLGADPAAPVRFARGHAEMEQQLKESGLAWTMLRPTGFMQNLLGSAAAVAGQGQIYAPTGESKVSFIDVADIAAVATIALTRPGHEGQTYELTGPEAVSYGNIADKLSVLVGKPVSYVEISLEQYEQALLGFGVPEWVAGGLVELDELVFRPGYAAAVSPAVEQVTGRPGRTIDEFFADNRQVFAA